LLISLNHKLMKLTVLLLSFVLHLSVIQPPTVKEQATKMVQALIRGDYKTFVHYTYPGLVKMSGGSDQLEAQLSKIMNQMKEGGVVVTGASFGAISKVVTSGKELQCTVEQHTEMKVPDGKIINTTTLIALSGDGGKNWTFVDTNNKDIATVRKLLPGLSNEIVIPKPQAPVRVAN
jgi:hypothetical protein